MKLNELILLSGIDIPFYEARVSIHQPTLKEIAYIGEGSFFMGCELLTLNKKHFSEEDIIASSNYSNFDIIMSIIKEQKDTQSQMASTAALMVLSLLFPDYKIQIRQDYIALVKSVEDASDPTHLISEEYSLDNSNYPAFVEILVDMFKLKDTLKESADFNPAGDLAKEIHDKIMRAKQKIAKQKNQSQQNNMSVFSRYISILAVGEGKNMNELVSYTPYQLMNEFERFQLKNAYDIYIAAKIQGAKGMENVEHWMKDLNEPSDKNK